MRMGNLFCVNEDLRMGLGSKSLLLWTPNSNFPGFFYLLFLFTLFTFVYYVIVLILSRVLRVAIISFIYVLCNFKLKSEPLIISLVIMFHSFISFEIICLINFYKNSFLKYVQK